MDPELDNKMHVTLMEGDIVFDDVIQTVSVDLNTLKHDVEHDKDLVFNKVIHVYIKIQISKCLEPLEGVRFSTDICDEEKEFRKKRKQMIFEAMQAVLGEKGPKTIDEVPTVAILGSGGGFRAMVSLSGTFCALKDIGIADCSMYFAGLSGSSWYISTLYSHPHWSKIHPFEVNKEIRDCVAKNWVRLLFKPSWMHKRISAIAEKSRRGEPVSFTDLFGYLVGDTLLVNRKNPLLSDQIQTFQDGSVPMPLYACVHVKKDVSAEVFGEWVELSPYEIGILKYGTYLKPHYFGNKYFCGVCIDDYPEPPLHFIQDHADDEIAVKKLCTSAKSKRMMVCDGGLVFNSPFPVMLRQEREVELILSFDYSAREKDGSAPFDELIKAEKWAKDHHYPFPTINHEEQFKQYGIREYYIFKNDNDPKCPVVIHFPLVNNLFKTFKAPGIPRTTQEEVEAGKMPLFEGEDRPYSTFNFHYLNEPFDRLVELNNFNVKVCKDVIYEEMAKCVDKKRKI